MSGIWLAVFGLGVFFLGFRFYSKYISERIYRLDPDYVTPAHQFNDGVDFVPTQKWVLWGHHFTSVAGAAPIIGPAIALYWGWLPALLWVVFGTAFAAGVHDFGALVLSARNKGQSIGTLCNRLIGKHAKILFLFIILILLLMVNAVFAWAIANLFIKEPGSVLSVFIQIPLAIWVGYAVLKKKGRMLVPALIALAVMYGAAVIATRVEFLQIDVVRYLGGEGATVMGMDAVSMAFLIWIAVLLVYVYFASTLPVWVLLQPRDYINAQQLVVGLLMLYGGMLVLNPELTAPAYNSEATTSWFPLLFITIACGAISGFHGLVASGTSSKQLNKETDARVVGYLGAVGEGTLALIVIIAVATFFGSQGEFLGTYSSFTEAGRSGLGAFVSGAGPPYRCRRRCHRHRTHHRRRDHHQLCGDHARYSAALAALHHCRTGYRVQSAMDYRPSCGLWCCRGAGCRAGSAARRRSRPRFRWLSVVAVVWNCQSAACRYYVNAGFIVVMAAGPQSASNPFADDLSVVHDDLGHDPAGRVQLVRPRAERCQVAVVRSRRGDTRVCVVDIAGSDHGIP